MSPKKKSKPRSSKSTLVSLRVPNEVHAVLVAESGRLEFDKFGTYINKELAKLAKKIGARHGAHT